MNATRPESPDESSDPAVPGGTEGGELSGQHAIVRFFVTDGDVTIGPVDDDLLARGIAAGKVPLDAQVWRTGWDIWRSVREYATENDLLPTNDKAIAAAKVARVSDLQPLMLPPTAVEAQTLGQAEDLTTAASVFLSLCATATGAECGWVHVRSHAAADAMMTIEGIGPRAQFGVGRTIDPGDQALRVAREGRTVLGEPIPGVVGSAVTARIIATGIAPVSVLMTPVLCGGQLLVMLELGVAHRDSGFSARDAAITEQIARDFSAIARKKGWHR
ncbi:MAG: DUF4339 domain-containing protein [Deltaproteobacteria bacterium]|nr:DUF4339 domain-containing protein [Deltaproteobacteria bacterium]